MKLGLNVKERQSEEDFRREACSNFRTLDNVVNITDSHAFSMASSVGVSVSTSVSSVNSLSVSRNVSQSTNISTVDSEAVSSGVRASSSDSSSSSRNTSQSTNVSTADSKAVSSGLNVPHDYTTGTWTPSVGGSATYTAQVGDYTRIGRLVHVTGRLTILLLGTGSANTVSGLPFNAAQNCAGSVLYFTGLAASVTWLSLYTNPGTATFTFTSLAAAATAMTNPSNVLGNGADIYFSITYFI